MQRLSFVGQATEKPGQYFHFSKSGKLCRLPPFCIDGPEMEEIVCNLAKEGKLGEKAQLAAAQIGADC